MKIRCWVGVGLFSWCLASDAGAALRRPGHAGGEEAWMWSEGFAPGVLIVKVREGVTVAEGTSVTTSGLLTQVLRQAGVVSLTRVFPDLSPLTDARRSAGMEDLSRVFYARFGPGLDGRSIARALNALDDIEYAEPKRYARLYDTPNDPLVTNQTGAFTRLNAFNGWTIAKGDSAVPIATVDGGTYWQHEDLVGNLWINTPEDINGNRRFDLGPPPAGDEDGIDQDGNGKVDDVIGWNFTLNSNNPRGLPSTPSNADHGTATASMFGARTNNALGMAGSSWNCRLMPICASSTTDYLVAYGYEGIVYAYQKGAKVINCSWGGAGGGSAFEQSVVTAATQAGALVVASAGNGGPDQIGDNNDLLPNYPANYRNVLGVGATQSTSDVKTSFSNYGVTIPVYAPGVSIMGALNNGSYTQTFMDGTSFSAPLVAGLAGILKSYRPTWTPRQIATQIRVTADSIDGVPGNAGFSGKLGRGRANFARALGESHPGIEITSAAIVNQRGGNLFLPGDTISITLVVQNILTVAANALTFDATPSDVVLSILQGSANAGNLAPGQQVTLTPFRFRVGALTAARDIVVKITWSSNVNDRDAYAYRVTVFPSTPLWETQLSPTQTSLYSVDAVNATTVWAAGGNGSATAPVVVRTTNGGGTWTLATGNLSGVDLYCISAIDANRAWVGTGNGRIYATTDGGAAWAQQTYPGTQSPFIDGIWFLDAGNGYAMGDPPGGGNNRYIVLKTTNGGATWSHTASEPVGGSNEAGWNNSFWVTDINHLWFGTNLSKIWRSTDGGASWLSAPSGSPYSFAVAFKDNTTGMIGHQTGLLQLSTNGGASWTSISSPATSAVSGISYIPGTTIAWFVNPANPYRTTNNGTAWTQQTLYPFSGSLNHLAFADTSNGWTVTSSGEILRYRPFGSTSAPLNEGAGTPVQFGLEQNFPNPFNPTTRFGFVIADRGLVSLRVFDVLGRDVATLVNDVESPGRHQVQWDASSMPSGVYFAVLRSNGAVATRKLLLMK